jgi:hypothetical protein
MSIRVLSHILAGCIAGAALGGGLRAADANDGDARLRETLRTTMQQLNDAQSQLAGLQAAQNAQADERKILADKVALLTKRAAEDQSAAAKDGDALKAKLSELQAGYSGLQQELAKWRAAAEKNAAVARAEAARRQKDESAAVALERKVEDLSAKNAELFRIGSEILDRYEKFSLGAQFLAREPFVGRARVELENQIQDYDDKLMDQRQPQ